ncbi:MAG: helix-turn-helix transcriptional regulator [Lachnospiraceae bacterium]|nr:helix-turn-helix transcriptional regulator [Lachnospiraceae bacterium]
MIINSSKDFGATIRKRRKELGYTQRYISEFTGFSISFISDLENGKSTAELGKAIYLANMLGLDVAVDARGRQ